MHLFRPQLAAVFAGRIVGHFLETAAERGQVVETGPEGYIGDVGFGGEEVLRFLDPFAGQIVVKGGVGVLFEQPGKMIFGKAGVIGGLFKRKIFHIVGIDIAQQGRDPLVMLSRLFCGGVQGTAVAQFEVIAPDQGKNIEQNGVDGEFPHDHIGKIDLGGGDQRAVNLLIDIRFGSCGAEIGIHKDRSHDFKVSGKIQHFYIKKTDKAGAAVIAL